MLPRMRPMRPIEIGDGNIISDRANVPENTDSDLEHQTLQRTPQNLNLAFFFWPPRWSIPHGTACHECPPYADFLTMLGIIIGIASVVSVVTLGNGSQKQILENISNLGTNTITVYQGVVLVITRVLHKSKPWCLPMQKLWRNNPMWMESAHLPIPVWRYVTKIPSIGNCKWCPVRFSMSVAWTLNQDSLLTKTVLLSTQDVVIDTNTRLLCRWHQSCRSSTAIRRCTQSYYWRDWCSTRFYGQLWQFECLLALFDSHEPYLIGISLMCVASSCVSKMNIQVVPLYHFDSAWTTSRRAGHLPKTPTVFVKPFSKPQPWPCWFPQSRWSLWSLVVLAWWTLCLYLSLNEQRISVRSGWYRNKSDILQQFLIRRNWSVYWAVYSVYYSL